MARVLSGRPPIGVRFIEHTADTGIEVRAPSLAGCFARSGAGMFACFTAPGTAAAAVHAAVVVVEATGLEELMVAWLEELIYVSEVRRLALHEFEVVEISSGVLKGSARGPEFGPGAAAVGPAVKAVTRHGLEVTRAGRGWRARIYFDV